MLTICSGQADESIRVFSDLFAGCGAFSFRRRASSDGSSGYKISVPCLRFAEQRVDGSIDACDLCSDMGTDTEFAGGKMLPYRSINTVAVKNGDRRWSYEAATSTSSSGCEAPWRNVNADRAWNSTNTLTRLRRCDIRKGQPRLR